MCIWLNSGESWDTVHHLSPGECWGKTEGERALSIAYEKEKPVAEYHLIFPVQIPKNQIFHSSHTYFPTSESNRINHRELPRLPFSWNKIDGETLPFREKDKDPQSESAIRWGWRIIGAVSQHRYQGQTNFLLSKLPITLIIKQPPQTKEQAGLIHSFKQGQMFSWVIGVRISTQKSFWVCLDVSYLPILFTLSYTLLSIWE